MFKFKDLVADDFLSFLIYNNISLKQLRFFENIVHSDVHKLLLDHLKPGEVIIVDAIDLSRVYYKFSIAVGIPTDIKKNEIRTMFKSLFPFMFAKTNIKSITYKKYLIYYVTFNKSLQPCYAYHNGYLIISSNLRLIKEVLDEKILMG